MRDRVILIAIAGTAFLFMIFQLDIHADLPYLTAVIILFTLSFALFLAFMHQFNRMWLLRFWIANAVAAVLLPIIEGMDYIWVTLVILLLLAGSMAAVYLLQSDQEDR